MAALGAPVSGNGQNSESPQPLPTEHESGAGVSKPIQGVSAFRARANKGSADFFGASHAESIGSARHCGISRNSSVTTAFAKRSPRPPNCRSRAPPARQKLSPEIPIFTPCGRPGADHSFGFTGNLRYLDIPSIRPPDSSPLSPHVGGIFTSSY